MQKTLRLRRRDLLSLPAVWPALASAQESAAAALPSLPEAAVRVLTPPPKHHFFGYYGIPPWNASQTRLVCLETDFQDRLPAPGEKARIGLVDADKGGFEPLTETATWNLQQGCMLYWHPLAADREILFNDRRGRDVITAVLEVENGRRRELPRAIAAVGNQGKYGLCIDYGRQGRMRKVVGYAAAEDPFASQPAPKDDGIWRMDLSNGESKLLVSIAEVYERLRGHPLIDGRRHMFFQHALFNRSDTRFLFLARVFTDPPRPELGMPMKEPRYMGGDLRCDLHPRWNRTGTQICFDALERESWTRQLHVATLRKPATVSAPAGG